MLAFFAATHIAPIVSCLLALGLVAGGGGATWWLWTVVAVFAIPALGLFAGALFLAEYGFETNEAPDDVH